MSDFDVTVTLTNNVYAHVYCKDQGILQELIDFFTFTVDNFSYMKKEHWSGEIKLLWKNGQIYAGLAKYVKRFCTDQGYTCELINVPTKIISTKEFISELNLPEHIEERDYQIMYSSYALSNKRATLVSPTGSGKSLIIYIILRHLLKHGHKQRGLLVVPTVNLVKQMYSDFESYSTQNGWNVEDHCQQVYEGQDKIPNTNLVISTWQSIYELDKDYFKEFDFIIGDEAHQFQAKSLKKIMESLINCDVRIGTTGTLSDQKVHKLVIEGLFGPAIQFRTTKELQEQKQLSPLDIQCRVLKYSDQESKLVAGMDYPEEIDYICNHEKRNEYIVNLALSLKGNTLILFTLVDKHGKIIYDKISQMCDNRKVFFIHGGVKGDQREIIRKIVNEENDAIIVASYGTMSTGTNIPNLYNLILASPTKSKIRILQSIGRLLRLVSGKIAVVYDLIDDFRYKGKNNYCVDQFEQRVKYYVNEKHSFKIDKINL